MYTVYKITRTYSVCSGGCQSASGEKNKIKIKSSTIWRRHSYTLHTAQRRGSDITLYYVPIFYKYTYVYTYLSSVVLHKTGPTGVQCHRVTKPFSCLTPPCATPQAKNRAPHLHPENVLYVV